MGLPRHQEAPASTPSAPSGVWRAVETLAMQAMADLVEQPLDGALARRRALEEAARELHTAFGALEATHTQLLTHQERLATLGRLAAELTHELANWLAVLTGGLGLLARELQQRPPDEVAWLSPHLERLQRATAQTLQLVSTLKTTAGSPRPTPQRLRVSALLEDLRELVVPTATARQITIPLEPDAELYVDGDRGQLLQILLNLATNALDAMASGGTLSLRARAEDTQAVLEVADTGPGIPPELAARIWEPFFTTKTEGTSLGLALARRLAEAHRGTLTLASRPGAGTTARLRLPACAPPVVSASTPPGASTPRTPHPSLGGPPCLPLSPPRPPT